MVSESSEAAGDELPSQLPPPDASFTCPGCRVTLRINLVRDLPHGSGRQLKITCPNCQNVTVTTLACEGEAHGGSSSADGIPE